MATVTTVKMVDDIDGSANAATVSFALDNTAYEIDLSAANAQQLRDALAPFIAHAQKSPARRAKRGQVGSSGSQMSRDQLVAVRAWARSNDFEVSDRGRLPAKVLEAFHAAH